MSPKAPKLHLRPLGLVSSNLKLIVRNPGVRGNQISVTVLLHQLRTISQVKPIFSWFGMLFGMLLSVLYIFYY